MPARLGRPRVQALFRRDRHRRFDAAGSETARGVVERRGPARADATSCMQLELDRAKLREAPGRVVAIEVPFELR